MLGETVELRSSFNVLQTGIIYNDQAAIARLAYATVYNNDFFTGTYFSTDRQFGQPTNKCRLRNCGNKVFNTS